MSFVTKTELKEFTDKYYPSEEACEQALLEVDKYDAYETHKTRSNEKFLQISKDEIKCFGVDMFLDRKSEQRELVARYCDHCSHNFQCAYISLLNCDLDGVYGGTLSSPRRRVIQKIKRAGLFEYFDQEAQDILIKLTKELQLIK